MRWRGEGDGEEVVEKDSEEEVVEEEKEEVE